MADRCFPRAKWWGGLPRKRPGFLWRTEAKVVDGVVSGYSVVVTMIVASVSVVVPIKLKPLANDAGAA